MCSSEDVFLFTHLAVVHVAFQASITSASSQEGKLPLHRKQPFSLHFHCCGNSGLWGAGCVVFRVQC